MEAIRRSFRRGQPYGGEASTTRIAEKLGLESTVRPRGPANKHSGRGRTPQNAPVPFFSLAGLVDLAVAPSVTPTWQEQKRGRKQKRGQKRGRSSLLRQGRDRKKEKGACPLFCPSS